MTFPRFVGLGVGLGANILLRHSLLYPDAVDSLLLINVSSDCAGWSEWAWQKRNVNQLKTQGITKGVVDYFLWYHFGHDCHLKLLSEHHCFTSYVNQWETRMLGGNVAMLVEQYINRSDIPIKRYGGCPHVPVLCLVGSSSPHVNDLLSTISKLDPSKTSWIKFNNSGNVLEEEPQKVKNKGLTT